MGPLAALILLLPLCSGAWGWGSPKVRVYLRAYQQGEPVLIVVTGNDPRRPPSGRLGGAPLSFFQPTPKTYLALAGIDLEASTGTCRLELALRSPAGKEMEYLQVLKIKPRPFATRRLEVAKAFVEPPPQAQAQAERETQRIKKVFAMTTKTLAIEGRFRMPVKGAKTTSRFGDRSVFNGQPRSPHGGADLKAKIGTPVLAPQAGTVALVEDLYFPGRTLMLDHGMGVYSFFAHLSEVRVRLGRRVKAGERIAKAGATGRVTGPHLHWSVKINGARVDPASMVKLPLDRWLKPRKSLGAQKRTKR